MARMPSSKTFGRLLAEHAANRGSADAIVFGTTRLSYEDLLREVRRTAKGFLRLGARRGDRIAAWLPNSADWVVMDLAAASIGCLFVTLNTWYTARELGHALSHSGAKVLLVTSRFRSHDYEAEFRKLLEADDLPPAGDRPGPVVAGLPELEHVVSSTPGFPGATHSLERVRAEGDELDDSAWQRAVDEVQPDDPALLLYTSGTTAAPKAVVLQHRGLIENGHGIGSRQHFEPEDRVWLGTPLFFSLGCANGLMAALAHGATFVLQDDLSLEAVLDTLIEERCTVYYAGGRVTMELLDLADLDTSKLSLRTGLCSGPEVIKAFSERLGMTEVCNLYGMTELYGNCAVTDAGDPLEVRMHSGGRALPGTEIRIVDPSSGRVVGADEHGEIQVRGYVTPGYYRDPERNAAAFTEDGFFRTGDLGYIDDDARVHWVDRLDDMIKTSGINVAPAEVEEVLNQEPRIKRSYVLGIPDDDRGKVVAAFIEFEEGASMTEEQVRDHCATALSSYKIPRIVRPISADEVPFTAAGKVHKRTMRDRYLESVAASR